VLSKAKLTLLETAKMDRQELDDSLNNALCQLDAGEAAAATTDTPALSLQSLSDQVSQIYQLQNVAVTKKEEELERLRHRVHYQEQLLQDKDTEIRKLEREQYRQQEERALELRSLIRRGGSTSTGGSPYHDEETDGDCGFISSCFTAFLAAFTSSSSSTRANIRRRQGTTQTGSRQWKLLDFIHAAIVGILVFHFWHFPSSSHLLEREAVYSSTLPKQQQSPSYSYQEPPPPIRINPWDSQPPNPIALFDTNNSPAVRQRHECIQAIRKRHVDIFGPMMKTTTQDPPLLVDPAYHANVGDHMLTLGEIKFIQETMNLGVPLQCHYEQAGGEWTACRMMSMGPDPR
jgi:hypothetical protein